MALPHFRTEASRAADRRHRSPAELVALIAGRASRLLGRGAGSSVPGMTLEWLDPHYVESRAASLSDGVVVVSGTNGKTTTASMIRAILREQGVETVGNETGANLSRGVATALLDAPADARMGVFEVDEGALRQLVDALQPKLMILTNVFRDQLDRFGETESVARKLGEAAHALPEEATIIANADDPLLWGAVEDLDPVGFGVRLELGDGDGDGDNRRGGDGSRSSPGTTHDPGVAIEAEPVLCPRCGRPLAASAPHTIAHLGPSRCEVCGWASREPKVLAKIVAEGGTRGLVLEVAGELVTLPVGGLHNAYNAAAAVAAAEALGVPAVRTASALERFRPRFGRAEELEVDGRTVVLELMKNPAAAGTLVENVVVDSSVGAIVVAVSDRTADGHDISWIWDADFEQLAQLGVAVVPSGTRAADIAVRLRYAGARTLPADPDLLAAIRAALAASSPGSTVVVLATYTAMLDVRASLLNGRHEAVIDASG